MSTNTLTYEEASALIQYDPTSGKFYWLARPRESFADNRGFNSWNAAFAGRETFTTLSGSGYRVAIVNGVKYRAHRVAWLLHHGYWPALDIDHINGIKTDNRIANLRDVSKGENQRNRCISKCNSTGVMGVCWDKRAKRWNAYIGFNGKRIDLGRFKAFGEAVSTRRAAERHYGFH